jgi:hypothetical protein
MFNTDKLIIWGIGVTIIGLFTFVVIMAVRNGKQWEEFKVSHNCKIVAHIEGDVFNTFSFDGNGNMSVGIGSTSDKKGWLCDDGQTYYR